MTEQLKEYSVAEVRAFAQRTMELLGEPRNFIHTVREFAGTEVYIENGVGTIDYNQKRALTFARKSGLLEPEISRAEQIANSLLIAFKYHGKLIGDESVTLEALELLNKREKAIREQKRLWGVHKRERERERRTRKRTEDVNPWDMGVHTTSGTDPLRFLGDQSGKSGIDLTERERD